MHNLHLGEMFLDLKDERRTQKTLNTGQVAREINVTFLNGLSLSLLGPNINH